MEVTAVVTLMSLAEAERCVSRIQEGMENVRALLLDLYEREGWKALGYPSWRECVTAELHQSVATVYRQLRAAEIDRAVYQVDKSAGPLPTVQTQALGRLPDDEARQEVYVEVQAQTNGRATAADYGAAVDRRLGVARHQPTRRAPDPDIVDDDVEDVNHESWLNPATGSIEEPPDEDEPDDESPTPTSLPKTQVMRDAYLRADFAKCMTRMAQIVAYAPARLAAVLPEDDAHRTEQQFEKLAGWLADFKAERTRVLRVVGE